MFKNQTTNQSDAVNVNVQQQNFSQEKDFKIEDVPIHTMEKDIYEIEHPEEKKEMLQEDLTRGGIDIQNLNEKQKTSPFLNPAAAVNEVPVEIAPKTPVVSTPQMQKIDLNSVEDVVTSSPQEIKKSVINEIVNLQTPKTESPSNVNIFLNPENKQAQVNTEDFQGAASEENENISVVVPKEDVGVYRNADKGGMLAILVAVVILLITGAGIYYFLVNYSTDTAKVAVEEQESSVQVESSEGQNALNDAPEKTTESIPVVETKTESLLVDKPNYLVADINQLSPAILRELVDEQVKKIKDSNLTSPIEFLVVDAKNNPVGFETFAKKVGIGFSSALINDLGSQFSLFIYNDQSDMRLGLAVSSKADDKLKTDMLKEESGIVNKLQALFISTEYKFDNNKFNSGQHNGMETRYLNAINGKNFSIDYLVTNNQLIIGTSMMTARGIVDYQNKNITQGNSLNQ